jgi:uncharacterized membrane protein YjjB (DUF3815 family)
MRRLVVLSVLLILAGLLLLLPSSALYSLLTKGTTSSSTTPSSVFRFAISSTSSTTDNTSTIESLVGFGLIAVGLVVELLSLITDVPGVASATLAAGTEPEAAQPGASPTSTAQPVTTIGEKKN